MYNEQLSVSQNLSYWLQRVKDQFNCAECDLVHFLIYGFSGLVVGLLFSNYGRLLITLICFLALTFFSLNYLQLIEINIPAFGSYLGVSSAQTFEDIIRFYIAWAQEHVAFCITAFIGFLIGLRLG